MSHDYHKTDRGGREPEVQVFHRWDPAADLQVLYAGFQACSPGHGWRGRRDHALVHHVIRGRGRVRLGRREWTLGPGDSFLYYPHTDLWYEADRTEPWNYLWVGFGGVRLTACLEGAGFDRDRPVLEAGETPVGCLFTGLLEALEDPGPAPGPRALGLAGRLFFLLEALARKAPGPSLPPPGGVPYVQEILLFLEQAYSRQITTETVARYAGLERTYCSHLFSTAMGKPLMRYLAELRMEKALVLLRTTGMSVRAVGESVGYPDAGAFAKRFRALKGVSPSEVRSGSGSP